MCTELRSGDRRALQRVSEGRREVDAAVEVTRLVEMGECKLEGDRQPGGKRATILHVGGLDDRAVDTLKEALEVLLTNEAQGLGLRLFGRRLHRRKQLLDLLFAALKV